MNASHILDALEMIDDNFILQAKEYYADNIADCHLKKIRTFRCALALIAAAVMLALCGFAAYEMGLFDYWLQKPLSDPVETVRNAIEKQIDKEYTITVSIDEIIVDAEETIRLADMYSSSEIAEERGWTDEYLAERFVVVKATYYVEYDHTKTFMNDGYTVQYFYLTQNAETGKWTIIDNTSPDT